MNRITLSRAIACIGLAIGALGLASCSKTESSPAAPSARPASDAQSDAKRQEIEKYNHYIKAINTDGKFDETLERNENRVVPALKAGQPLSALYVAEDYNIKSIKKELEAGLALSTPMPQLDAPAKTYAQALARLEPLNHELKSYADTKGYLSDNGAKAREQLPAYQAALQETVAARDAFDAATDKQDMARIKENFDQQQAGSADYYKAGLIYHAKLSMAASNDFFTDINNPAAQETFKASLDKVNDMLTGLEGQLASEQSCYTVKSMTRAFLSNGRQILADAKNGKYKNLDESRKRSLLTNINTFRRDSTNLVTVVNMQRC